MHRLQAGSFWVTWPFDRAARPKAVQQVVPVPGPGFGHASPPVPCVPLRHGLLPGIIRPRQAEGLRQRRRDPGNHDRSDSSWLDTVDPEINADGKVLDIEGCPAAFFSFCTRGDLYERLKDLPKVGAIFLHGKLLELMPWAIHQQDPDYDFSATEMKGLGLTGCTFFLGDLHTYCDYTDPEAGIRREGLKARMEPPQEFVRRINRLCIQMTHSRRRSDSRKERKRVLRGMKKLVKVVGRHARRHRDLLDREWEKTGWTRRQSDVAVAKNYLGLEEIEKPPHSKKRRVSSRTGRPCPRSLGSLIPIRPVEKPIFFCRGLT